MLLGGSMGFQKNCESSQQIIEKKKKKQSQGLRPGPVAPWRGTSASASPVSV